MEEVGVTEGALEGGASEEAGGAFVGDEFFGHHGECVGDIDSGMEVDDEGFDVDEGAHGGGEFGGDADAEFLASVEEIVDEGLSIEFGQGCLEVFLEEYADIVFEIAQDNAARGCAELDKAACDHFGVGQKERNDDARHEGALGGCEAANKAEVQERDFVIGGYEEVSGVGVGVEDAIIKYHLEGKFYEVLGGGFGEVGAGGQGGDFFALDVAHHEDIGARELDVGSWEYELRVIFEAVFEVLDVMQFVGKIELLNEGLFEFLNHLGEVKIVEFFEKSTEPAGKEQQDINISADERHEFRALDFEHKLSPVQGCSAVDLSNGGRARWSRVDVGEVLFNGSDGFMDNALKQRELHGLNMVLELLEFVDVGLWQQIGARREDLAEFYISCAELIDGFA